MSPTEVTSCSCSSLACPSLVTGTPLLSYVQHTYGCYPRFAHLLSPVPASRWPVHPALRPRWMQTLHLHHPFRAVSASPSTPEQRPSRRILPLPPHTSFSANYISVYLRKILTRIPAAFRRKSKFLSMNWPLSASPDWPPASVPSCSPF